MGVKEQIIFPEIDYDKMTQFVAWIYVSRQALKTMKNVERSWKDLNFLKGLGGYTSNG